MIFFQALEKLYETVGDQSFSTYFLLRRNKARLFLVGEQNDSGDIRIGICIVGWGVWYKNQRKAMAIICDQIF